MFSAVFLDEPMVLPYSFPQCVSRSPNILQVTWTFQNEYNIFTRAGYKLEDIIIHTIL